MTMANAAALSVPKTADGYIRVSKVAGREGESFISPDIQRKKITAWAELHDVEIVQWWEELDMSGADRTRPMFQLALERCERGETGRSPMCDRRKAEEGSMEPKERLAVASHNLA